METMLFKLFMINVIKNKKRKYLIKLINLK